MVGRRPCFQKYCAKIPNRFTIDLAIEYFLIRQGARLSFSPGIVYEHLSRWVWILDKQDSTRMVSNTASSGVEVLETCENLQLYMKIRTIRDV